MDLERLSDKIKETMPFKIEKTGRLEHFLMEQLRDIEKHFRGLGQQRE